VVGGPDPYWTSYRYDTVGDRTQDTSHAASGDTTHTYSYPEASAPHPHGVTQVVATGAQTGTSSYGYDNAGNTTTRNLAGKPGQTLTWDVEGHLATVTDTTGTSSYTYDASGNRLVAHDSTGTTLYLAGTEVHRDTGGAISCTRFYGSAAVRTNPGGLIWLASDNHGTGELGIDAGTLAVTRRKTDPFGNPRGTPPAWPTTHGFVNGPTDPTGLTHLGAREYDPGIGRFISVDPILDPADPIQMNGYAYADNNPTTASDPSGLLGSASCEGGMVGGPGRCTGGEDGQHVDSMRGFGSGTSSKPRSTSGGGGGGTHKQPSGGTKQSPIRSLASGVLRGILDVHTAPVIGLWNTGAKIYGLAVDGGSVDDYLSFWSDTVIGNTFGPFIGFWQEGKATIKAVRTGDWEKPDTTAPKPPSTSSTSH
jgi:RHS repeat-associated protein